MYLQSWLRLRTKRVVYRFPLGLLLLPLIAVSLPSVKWTQNQVRKVTTNARAKRLKESWNLRTRHFSWILQPNYAHDALEKLSLVPIERKILKERPTLAEIANSWDGDRITQLIFRIGVKEKLYIHKKATTFDSNRSRYRLLLQSTVKERASISEGIVVTQTVMTYRRRTKVGGDDERRRSFAHWIGVGEMD